MTKEIKLTYKGQVFTLTMRGNDIAYAQDEQGYFVSNPSLFHALAITLINHRANLDKMKSELYTSNYRSYNI